MKRLFFLTLLLILTIVAPAISSAQQKPKIGVSTALTGPAASFGTDIKNVLLFANKHLANSRFELVFEDDKCEGKEAVTIAHKFVSAGDIRFVVGNCSATIIAAAPIYEKAGILVFAPLASSPHVTLKTKNVIRTSPNDSESAQSLADIAFQKVMKMGVLTEQSDYSQDFLDEFKKAAKSKSVMNSIEVVNENFGPTDSDFRAVLLKMKGAGVDALFINANTEKSFAVILKQMKQLNIDLPVYGAHIPGSSTFRELAGADANGIIFVDFPSYADVAANDKENLYEKFVAEYGKPNAWDIVIATTLEAFRLIHNTLNAKDLDVRSHILHNNYEGVFGRYHFDEHGNIQGISPIMQTIKNGKIRALASVREEESCGH